VELGAVADQVDAGGGRGDPLLQEPAAQEGVDEGALAGVELAGDDEQEELVELARRALEGRLVLGRGVEAGERPAQLGEQPPVLGEQLVLSAVEDAPQHRRGP